MAGGGRRRLFSGLDVLLLLLLLLQAPPAESASSHGRSSSSSSVFSLFNLRQKSRFWSESVIRGDFDDLESLSPGKKSALNYSQSGNIANYLKLQEVESVYLPIPVNFIFIGFEGKGNQEFKLQTEELERWFTNIDHIFKHTRIPPVGEVLNPFYKISVDKTNIHFPSISHITHNFSVHAIQMNEKVTSVFQHAIDVLARKDDVSATRDDAHSLWQVDLDLMEALFSSLVEYLGLGNAYNIFILNPKAGVKRAKYGYRRGLSESEMNLLRENSSLQATIKQSGILKGSFLALDKMRRPLYEKHPMAKFAWTVTEETDTVEWSNICLEALDNIKKLYEGKDTAEIIQRKVLQLLHGQNEDVKSFLERELKSGEFSGVHIECLTDTWIGKDRWAFIDLTAGPFSWGPGVGGEGVRTEQSLPNVGKTIGAVAEISEEEAEDRLQDAIQEKFSVFGDGDHQAIDILLAEIDIYELFAFKHCKGRKVKLPLCEELDERMRELKNELQSFEDQDNESHKRKAVEALKRMERWNLFSDTHEEFQNYTVARDNFLAHLGATLWSSMRRVIAPCTADGRYHYYEKISFQLFFVTQENVRSIKKLPVDLKALKNGLSSLVLPSQKVMFSEQMFSLSYDPALAMAFSVARRAAAVPMLLVNGTYRKTVRNYLDSSILQHHLQRLGDSLIKGAHAHSRSTLEVPIFWFIHGDTLLVDKHYLAKALSDMVIVVQSEAASWESHFQCNGKSILWDFRRPIKAAIAAASEHIAGLVPLHLVYSHAHESAAEDWIWSVGCNPYSITSQGWNISQFQSDTIARSYIITTLEESIQAVNSVVNRLSLERTSEKSFKLFQPQESELVNKYNHVVGSWKRVATVTGELRYGDAVKLLYNLEDSTNRFVEQVNGTIAALHPVNCMKEREVHITFDAVTVSAFAVVSLILWVVLRPRRPKPKIN